MKLSGFIISTKDENLDKAIDSLINVCDEILVIFTENNIDLKTNAKIRYEYYEFNGDFSSVRNYAVSQLSGDYIIYIDSDEELLDFDFKDKIDNNYDGYYVNIKFNEPFGCVTKRQIRIFKKCCRFKNSIIEYPMTDSFAYLDVYINHIGYSSKEDIKKRALKMLELIDKIDKHDFYYNYSKAYYYFLMGEYEISCKFYKEAYSLIEDDTSVLFFRDMAVSLIYAGLNAEAVSIIKEGIQKQGCYGELYFYLAIAYKKIHDYKNAKMNLIIARETIPDLMLTYTEGYNNYINYYLEGEIYEQIEDFMEAAKAFTKAAEANSDYKNCIIKTAAALKALRASNNEIEEYIKINFKISEDEFAEIMSLVYKKLNQWQDALKFAQIIKNSLTVQTIIDCLYHMKEYKKCFNEILTNYCFIDKKSYGIVALCCIIMDKDISHEKIIEFLSRYKKDGYNEIVNAYNFFAYNMKYVGDKNYIQKFCNYLIETSDGRCIKYVRNALENVKSLDYFYLAEIAYNYGLYYFSEEIINLYCKDYKYDYKVLLLLSKIYYKIGNISEAQKYISYAMIFEDSIELKKLFCLCKLSECKNILRNKDGSFDSFLFNKVYKSIEKAEDALIL